MGERGVGVGGGIGLVVGLEEGEVIESDLDLPLSCIVCFVLLCLEETAATGVATAAESAEIAISLTVLAAMSAFSVPVIALLAHNHVNPFCVYKEHPVYSHAYVL